MDLFPNQALIDRHELRTMLGIESDTSWRRFLETPVGKLLPKPVAWGTTVKWHKDEILAFIKMLPRKSNNDEK